MTLQHRVSFFFSLFPALWLLASCSFLQDMQNKDLTPQQRINNIKILIVAINKEIAEGVTVGYLLPDEAQDMLDASKKAREDVGKAQQLLDLKLALTDVTKQIEVADKAVTLLQTQLANYKKRNAAKPGGS